MSKIYPHPRSREPRDHPSTPAGAPLPVVVVGGGPVGLATALGLARRGVEVTVLEADLSASFGSRAICLSRHSLEMLDRLGVGAGVDQVALPWTGGRSFYRSREVLSFQMPHGAHDVRPPMVNMSQSEVEEVLADTLEAHPSAEIRWGSRVTDLIPHDDHVELTVETPFGTRVLRSSWVVATDGARSRVREALGLRMAGTSYEGRYVIADIHWPSDLPTERLVWFDPVSNPGSTIIMHRQPRDIWRVDYQLSPGEDAEQEVREDRVRARIGRHLAWLGNDLTWTLEWHSLYRAHALSLDRYLHEHIVFAGDAAHLVPIFGVRGLNSGLEDAETLAWQLAAVVRGTASPELLESYASERRAAWEQNIAAAGKSTRIMTPGSRGYTATRDALLSLAVGHPEFRQLVDPRQANATHARSSPLTWGTRQQSRTPTPGDPVADRRVRVRTPDGERASSLHHERGTGFSVIGVDVAAPALAAGAQALEADLYPEPVHAVLVNRSAATGPPITGVTELDDRDGDLAAALGVEPGELLVVRPDGLLLCRLRDDEPLRQLAAHVRNGTSPTPAGTGPKTSSGASATPAPPETALETAWQAVSEGLDRVPRSDHAGLLTRLVLLLAEQTSPEIVARAVDAAVETSPPVSDTTRAASSPRPVPA